MEVLSSTDSFSVRWSNHPGTIVSLLEKFYIDESYVDCSLAAGGREISAHKLILSACSPFLNDVLKKHGERHPIIVLRDCSFEDLSAVVEYIYKGEVSLSQDRLTSFLKTAEMLSVAGLSDIYQDKKRARSDASEDRGPAKRILLKNEAEEKNDDDVNDFDDSLNDQIEFLSEEMVTKDVSDDKEKDDYKLILIDDSGSLKELGHVYSDGHFKSDMDDVLLKCNILSEDSPTKDLPPQLSRARRVRHQDYNIHCEKCGGIYKHEASFLNHLKEDCSLVHTCVNCMKSFKNKRHLMDHVRDDCGRIHVCPNCSRSFKQKVNLTTHQKHYCKMDNKNVYAVIPKS